MKKRKMMMKILTVVVILMMIVRAEVQEETLLKEEREIGNLRRVYALVEQLHSSLFAGQVHSIIQVGHHHMV